MTKKNRGKEGHNCALGSWGNHGLLLLEEKAMSNELPTQTCYVTLHPLQELCTGTSTSESGSI